MNDFESIVAFFKNGGSFMIPIAVTLAVGLVVTLERWLFLTYSKTSNKRAYKRAIAHLKKRDYKSAVSEQSRVPMSKIIAAGIARMSSSPRRDDIELAMEEGVLEAIPRLERRTSYIAVLANIATLLGLLGTIIGLIGAFESITALEAAEKAAKLSGDISTAMNTTAFGLISAIPLLLFHAMLQNKTTEIIDSLEMASVKVLNILATQKALTNKTRSDD